MSADQPNPTSGRPQGASAAGQARPSADATTQAIPTTAGAESTAAQPRPAGAVATQPGSPQAEPTRPGDARGGNARPARQPRAQARKVRLTVARIDPWSALKMSLLFSVAFGIAMVVMVVVLWMILAGMGVFDQVNSMVGSILNDGSNKFNIMDFVGLGRVTSLSMVIAVIDVVLMTAIGTISAFIYNASAALVGGLQLTLTDD